MKLYFAKNYKAELCKRYKLSDIDGLQEYELLHLIAKKGDVLYPGRDTYRAAGIVLMNLSQDWSNFIRKAGIA